MHSEDTVLVPLTQGKFAIIDCADSALIQPYKWQFHSAGYAVRRKRCGGGKRITYLMHRVIVNAPEGMEVDHINGIPLDNRRCNLRIATHQQNIVNAKVNKRNTSGFRGVSWAQNERKWYASIRISGRSYNLGLYNTPERAARAYDAAALAARGEFAQLNFPDEH